MMTIENSINEDESISKRDSQLQTSLKWLEDTTNGTIGYELESRTVGGLKVVQARTGFLLCNFIVPAHASDMSGNWHVGAIATIIDNIAAAAIYSTGHHLNVTVNFNISYFSTAKIKEEVEIEAKVKGNKGKLTSVVVKVRNKAKNGESIAIATQWTASNDHRSPKPQSKL